MSLNRYERAVVADLARKLEPPGDERTLHRTLALRLGRWWGIEARVLLYVGMMLSHLGVQTRDFDPHEVALALATRSPSAWPRNLRPYVVEIQAKYTEMVELDRRTYRREHLAMLRSHFGADPELFD